MFNTLSLTGKYHSPKIVSYPESFEGIILSFADVYPFDDVLYEEVKKEWEKYADYLRY